MKKNVKTLKKLYRQYAEYINYFIVGTLSTVVSLGSKYALLFTLLDASNGVHLQISVAISWIITVIFAYFMNRRYVFHSQDPHILKEFILFVGGRIFTLILESFTLWFFITFLGLNSDFQVIIWTLLAQFLIFVGNYVISKLVVFKKPPTKRR